MATQEAPEQSSRSVVQAELLATSMVRLVVSEPGLEAPMDRPEDPEARPIRVTKAPEKTVW